MDRIWVAGSLTAGPALFEDFGPIRKGHEGKAPGKIIFFSKVALGHGDFIGPAP
jgi:hypothetical protein